MLQSDRGTGERGLPLVRLRAVAAQGDVSRLIKSMQSEKTPRGVSGRFSRRMRFAAAPVQGREGGFHNAVQAGSLESKAQPEPRGGRRPPVSPYQ
jgi:hypothetical protein